jgi:predicted alpha/beta-fold hydrolase
MRGAGASAGSSRGLYHAGKTQDIRDVLMALTETAEALQPVSKTVKLALMGFSLGANITIKLVGEPLEGISLAAAVAVSAPLDLAYGAQHLAQAGGGMYERFLVAGLKRQMLQPTADRSSRLTTREQTLLPNLRTIVEFDDAITAPRHGWSDAAEYYSINSSGQFLPLIRTPTLVIHSVDDPMIPAKPYGDVDWEELAATGHVNSVITERGGHVGFHARGTDLPWFVDRAVEFLIPCFREC